MYIAEYLGKVRHCTAYNHLVVVVIYQVQILQLYKDFIFNYEQLGNKKPTIKSTNNQVEVYLAHHTLWEDFRYILPNS